MPDKVDFDWTFNQLTFEERRPACPNCGGLQKMAWLEGTYYCLQCGLALADCEIGCSCYWFQSGSWKPTEEASGIPGTSFPIE